MLLIILCHDSNCTGIAYVVNMWNFHSDDLLNLQTYHMKEINFHVYTFPRWFREVTECPTWGHFGLCSFIQIKFTMVVNIYIINKKLFRLQLWKMEVHKTWFN